jgi:hypothetical protein
MPARTYSRSYPQTRGTIAVADGDNAMRGAIKDPARSRPSKKQPTVTVEVTEDVAEALLEFARVLEGQRRPAGEASHEIQQWVQDLDGDARDIGDAIIDYIERTGDQISASDARRIVQLCLDEVEIVDFVTPSEDYRIATEVAALLTQGRLLEFRASIQGMIQDDLDAAVEARTARLAEAISQNVAVDDPDVLAETLLDPQFWAPDFRAQFAETAYYAPLADDRAPSALGTSAQHSLAHLHDYLTRNLDIDTGALYVENTYQLDVVVSRMWNGDRQVDGVGLQIVPDAVNGVIDADAPDTGKMTLLQAGMFPEGLNMDGTPLGAVIPVNADTLQWARLHASHGSRAMRYALQRDDSELIDPVVR